MWIEHLPHVILGLRLGTALLMFSVTVHRTVRYLRGLRRR